MVDILYPIFVIYYTSKLKKTGLRASKFTTFTAYSFLMISLIQIAFGSLALIVFSIPIFGFLYFRAIGVILFSILFPHLKKSSLKSILLLDLLDFLLYYTTVYTDKKELL